MSTIIVLGAGGQLGQCLRLTAGSGSPLNIVFPDEQEGNITDQEALMNLFSLHKPAYCINCAAYTAVDKAETDQATALLVNQTGVEYISRACKEFSTVLIHVSTDFVFEGDDVRLLGEEDAPKPVNVYGSTKLGGEQVIPPIIPHYFILRTSWLYSEYGNNFVKTMLRLSKERDSLGVIADQAGTPTYAPDLAAVILHIIRSESKEYGLYHYSNEGVASWFDFAKAIFQISDTRIVLNAIKGSAYPTPARRPSWSVMDKTKIKSTLNIDIPYWRDSLQICIANLTEKTNS